MTLRSYLHLLRLPNVFTAVTNVFTGCAAVGVTEPPCIALLAASSACLYTGGIVLNDYCDAEVDRVERPTRPLPSGAVTPAIALILAAGFLAAGIILSAFVNSVAAVTASVIVLLVATYNLGLKHVPVVGPLNMASCRFGNVLLGACALPAISSRTLPFATAMAAWVYIISIVSAREVRHPSLQTVVKTMVLMIPVLDGVFVGCLASPLAGIAVAAFSLPGWLLARRLYVT